jgi:hypothetical protein
MLPSFYVEPVQVDEADGSTSMYVVTCPRKECGREFWVPLSWAVLTWVDRDLEGRLFITGRPCPHCSMASAIPEGVRVTPSEPRSPRVVRRRRAKA